MRRVFLCLLLSATAAATTSTAGRELVLNTRYNYSYRLYYTPSQAHPNSSTAVQTVETEVLQSLQTMTTDTNVTVTDVGDTTLQPCTSNDMSSQFSQCFDAVTFIDAVLDDSMLPPVVERGILNHVRVFVSTSFNELYPDIHTLFVAPIYRSTSIRLTLVGLTEIMNVTEANLFVTVFQTRMQEALNPIYTLQQVQILLQDALGPSTTAATRRLDMVVRNTVDSSSSAANTAKVIVSMFLQAICSSPSTNCTLDNLNQTVAERATELASSLLTTLQAQGSTELRSPYFDQLQEILIEKDYFSNDLPPVPEAYVPDTPTGEVPIWLWIVLGVDGLILVLAMLWVVFKVRRRQRENRDRKVVPVDKDDDNQGEQVAVVVETIEEEHDAPLFPDDQPDIRLGDDLSRISFDDTTTDLRRTASQASSH